MNREFKFRVWISDEKRFRYCDYIPTMGFVWCMDGTRLELGENYPQQFTGCLDKNKKEIYEGDIVKVKFRRCGDFTCKIIYEARAGGWASFEFYTLPEEELSFPMSIKDIPIYIEIIGNIYENPELL